MMTPKTTEDSPLGGAIAQLRGNVAEGRTQWKKGTLKARLFGDAAPQRRIGRYAVGQCLGAGGMGEVYAARDEALDRPVALKLLHSNLDVDEESRARMLREAKTLAKLSHPNVVQIYEVGEDEEQIFIAMEFIAGTSLRQWLADERRGWREVLARYLKAGQGLAAVHRAGLVHRDFKPDNVLIGEDGRVCVADFGLARPVGVSGGGAQTDKSGAEWGGIESGSANSSPATDRDSMHITRTNRVAGTPAYMAPEQLRGRSVNARSDQFGFCVALYEGLYRRRPFEGRSLAARMVAMDGGPSVPPRRSKVPRRLWRLLVRGLAVEPEARFDSLDVLLRRLDPARTRRRRALVMGGFVVTAGSTAMIAATRPPDPCPRPSAEELGWGVEERARVDAGIRSTGLAHAGVTADAVLERLDERIADLAQVQQETCEATHVRRVQPEELFEQRMFCLEGVEGRLRGILGVLDEPDAEAVDNAVETIETLPRAQMCTTESLPYGMAPPTTPEQANKVERARMQLGRLWAELMLGDTPRVARTLEEVAEELEAVDYEPLTAELRHLQGRAAYDMGNPEHAIKLWTDAVEIAEGNRHDLLAAESWSELTFARVSGLSAQSAEPWIPHVRAAVRRIGNPARLSTAVLQYEGELALYNGRIDEARALFAQVLEKRRTIGEPLPIASAAGSLASLYKLTDEPGAALILHEEQRAIYESGLGSTHPRVAGTDYNMGAMLVALGREGEAREHLESARAIWTGRYGADYLDLALVHIALHQVELAVGTVDRGVEHALRARDIRRSNLPANHVDIAEAEMVVGISRIYSGEAKAAAESCRIAWERFDVALGTDDPVSAIARMNLAEALLALGRHDEALEHSEAAWPVIRSALPDSTVVAIALKVRGQLALARGDIDSAVSKLNRALTLVESSDTRIMVEYGDVMLSLSRALMRKGDLDAAFIMADSARAAFSGRPGELSRRIVTSSIQQIQVVSTKDQ